MTAVALRLPVSGIDGVGKGKNNNPHGTGV